MNNDDFYFLGKILKTSGSKGHLIAFLDTDRPERYKKLESVFVAIDHERIPFFIRSIELKPKNQALILFEDFPTADDAEVFTGRELYLPLSLLPPLKGKKFYYHEVRGFDVVDKVKGPIGHLSDVLDLPQQSLMVILDGSCEILVPLNDETLQKVDRKTKTLYIHAPEGLIDLYR